MKTLLIHTGNEQEERVLLAFLNSLKYNYAISARPEKLSTAQQEEILRRERDFEAGKIKSERWEEVRKRFFR